jgi:D-alanyl-D-alanine carboxypeptidase (penicillin-binding protein 5/6)
MYVTLPKGADSAMQASVQSTAGLIAPVTANSQVGMLNVTVDGRLLTQAPLYTLKAVDQGNIFRRMWDSMRLWFTSRKK